VNQGQDRGDGIRGGRVRRTVPLATLTARTAGEAVVVPARVRELLVTTLEDLPAAVERLRTDGEAD